MSHPIPTLPFALLYGALMAFWAWPLIRHPERRDRTRAVQSRMGWTSVILLGGMLFALQLDAFWNWGWWGLVLLPMTVVTVMLGYYIIRLQRLINR